MVYHILYFLARRSRFTRASDDPVTRARAAQNYLEKNLAINGNIVPLEKTKGYALIFQTDLAINQSLQNRIVKQCKPSRQHFNLDESALQRRDQ